MNTLEKREELSLNNNLLEALNAMTEGNIGAINVMWEMLTRSEPAIFLFELLLPLDDMNIRGTQIWIGFKDYCGEDLATFENAIRNRDQGMIDRINDIGRHGNHPHKAVRYGGSSKREFL